MRGKTSQAGKNTTVVQALSWFPFTAPTMMLLRVPTAEAPLTDIGGSIAMLLLAVSFATVRCSDT